MKRLITTISSLVAMYMLSQAQPLLNQYSAYEDFSTATEYIKDQPTNLGINWWITNNSGILLTRDFANKKLNVSMPQPAYQYNAFGISFGDSNGAEVGGTANTIDLSGNGIFSFDIINTGTEGLSIRVACVDINNVQVDCSPGAVTFNDIWKYQTQIIIPAGDTVRFEPGTANGAGGGIINDCDFSKGVWGDYVGGHKIRTDCDLKHIKQINLTVLNSAKNAGDGHALALINGQFSIQNFIVGDTSSTAAPAPDPEIINLPIESVNLDGNYGSKQTLYVEANGRWSIKSNVTWLDTKIYSSETGQDSIRIIAISNTTNQPRTATVTLSAPGVESKTFTVVQESKNATELNTISSNKGFKVIGNSILIEDSNIIIYTFDGKEISSNNSKIVLLENGEYIIQSKSGSEKIIIKE